MKITSNIVWGQNPAHCFSGNALPVRTPAEAVSAASILSWKTGIKTAVIGRTPSSVSQAQERAFTSGLVSQGVQVYLAGECTLPLLRHILLSAGPDAAYYITPDSVTPIASSLLPFSRDERRRIENALARQDAPAPYTGLTRRPESIGRFDLSYFTFLSSAAAGALRRLKAAVFAQSEPLLYMTDRIFSKIGLPVRVEWEEDMMELDESETGAYLSADGTFVRFADSDGILNKAENELLFAHALIESGEKTLMAPPGATKLILTLTEGRDILVEFFDDSYQWSKALIERSPHQFHMRFDALYACVNIFTRLCEEGISIREFRKRIPSVVRMEREVSLPNELRASTLRNFLSNAPEGMNRDNWFFRTENGCAWVMPDDAKPCVTLSAEAASAEFASEIIDKLETLIREAQKN